MKVPGQEKNAKECGPTMSHTCGNGSGSPTSAESQSLHIERSGSRGPADRKATGPRTKQGKQRASLNSTKHAIFSNVLVLESESRTEHQRLLGRLWKTAQPVGAFEELSVENLATIVWRKRRLFLAEGAEIRKNTEFVEWDQRLREREEAEILARLSDPLNNHGLIGGIHNPDVLARCLGLLAQLREQIEKDGLNPENDKTILERIYGDREENRLCDDFCDDYLILLTISQFSEEERLRKRCVSPEQCRKKILQGIDKEICRLKRYREVRISVEAVRTQVEALRHSIPDAPGLDRILRYEAHLDRAWDRTLSQLERQQRIRLGQSVLPPIKIDIAS
jgi:hypothetical protein